ncbi:MAG TPA: hypothetical protein VEC14_12750 [Reyranellaceae bacterium]|nr:hypothetical protein [Reyranellaceae bacterium]
MTDERLARVPIPHLRTRPATMLTAIGLCVIIVLLQLAPEIREFSARSAAANTVTAPQR